MNGATAYGRATPVPSGVDGASTKGRTAQELLGLASTINELDQVASHLNALGNRLGVEWPPATPSAPQPAAERAEPVSILDRLTWQHERLLRLVREVKTAATAIDATL